MKLNKFFISLAVICSLAPSLVYPAIPLINAIVRIETFAKDGKKIHLLGDNHDLECPGQKEEIRKGLAQCKASVYVEDLLVHSSNKRIENSLDPRLQTFCRKKEDCMMGLTDRLSTAGIPASSVECRLGLYFAQGKLKPLPERPSNQEIVNDYKNIVASLERSLPNNPMGSVARGIIKQIKEREKQSLAELEQNTTSNVLPSLGGETVDMLALTRLCDTKAPSQVAFIGGDAHCNDLAVVLENKLGYERINCVETASVRRVTSTYEPFLPASKKGSSVS